MSETPVDYIAQANMVHANGPYVTPPSTLYFTYTRSDGLESFIGPAAAAEQHLREGCTITGEQTIEDWAAFQEAQAGGAGTQSARSAKADDEEPAPKAHKAHEAKE